MEMDAKIFCGRNSMRNPNGSSVPCRFSGFFHDGSCQARTTEQTACLPGSDASGFFEVPFGEKFGRTPRIAYPETRSVAIRIGNKRKMVTCGKLVDSLVDMVTVFVENDLDGSLLRCVQERNL